VNLVREVPNIENTTHIWSGENNPHRIKQDGRSVLLRQCSSCRRDFAQGIDGLDWRAVYIGVFKIEVLADAISSQWLEEDCPKRRLSADDIARTTGR
jgi:hypothetical protein